MLYLKNSLVNIAIILFSLLFLSILSADEGAFIFPQKKNLTIKTEENKKTKIEKYNNNKFIDLPQKKPIKEKKITKNSVKTIESNMRDIWLRQISFVYLRIILK